MAEEKCNAPCIIRTKTASYLVSCGEKHGHLGKHSLELRSRGGVTITTRWNYLGDTGMPFNPRELTNVKRASPSVELDLGICCEKDPQHDGVHTQSGICHLLGAWWTAVW